jgi:hypothetical protein
MFLADDVIDLKTEEGILLWMRQYSQRRCARVTTKRRKSELM